MNKQTKFDIVNYVEEYMEERETGGENSDIFVELQQKERDLMFAAELGKALLASNEELKTKNDQIISEFHQKIAELEQAKHSLQLKLDLVGNDYESQVRELQSDIISLRDELKKQRKMTGERENERAHIIKELKQQNERLNIELGATVASETDLSTKVTVLQTQVANKRCSMHEHLHQVELLRNEMSELYEKKKVLEKKLSELTTERDLLIARLQESQEHMNDMERKTEKQAATIAHQQEEISQLEETASLLQEKVETLSLQTSRPESVLSTSVASVGHGETSLLAELTGSSSRPGNLPAPLSNTVGLPWHPLDEEEDIEVDDEVLMMSGAFTCGMERMTGVLEKSVEPQNPGLQEEDFLRELHGEVVDVYSQLRVMCSELGPTQPGKTPDKLALVEMDFRLGSLRYVLGELKGLLHDLVHFHSNIGTPERIGTSAQQFVVAELQDQVAQMEKRLRSEKDNLMKVSKELEMYEMILGDEEEVDRLPKMTPVPSVSQDKMTNQKPVGTIQEEIRTAEALKESHGMTRTKSEEVIRAHEEALERREKVEREIARMQHELASLNSELIQASCEDPE